MGKPSLKSVARYGTPVRCSVTAEVAQALISESKRIERTVEHTASEILATWYALDWLPTQKEKKK